MLERNVVPGQRFQWTENDGVVSGDAEVLGVRSDIQEGLSPEIEDYAARWMEAKGLSGVRVGETFTVMLGTDGKGYLDGKEICIKIFDPNN